LLALRRREFFKGGQGFFHLPPLHFGQRVQHALLLGRRQLEQPVIPGNGGRWAGPPVTR
jgi:hypothetical protein